MQTSPKLDNATRSFLQFRLRARPDLIVTPIRSAMETWYRIECPSTERFFRVGSVEYAFLSLLDGRLTIADVIAQMSQSGDAFAIDERHAEAIVGWLIDNRLIEGLQTESIGLDETVQSQQRRLYLEMLNPFWMKFPLIRPDRWIAACLPAVNWLFSPIAFVLAVILWSYATIVAMTDWNRFCDPFEAAFHPSNWLWLSATWVVMKCIHEFAHAFVCRRYGGAVREMGIVLILFAPVAYVDVTASHRFKNRWQRMHVAAAGMYAELIIAAVAVLVWSHTTSPVTAQRLLNVIYMTGFSTLVFNANPLMKFDGYHILADWLEIQNLSARGRGTLWRSIGQLLFGFQSPTSSLPDRNARILLVYGLCSTIWNMLLGICMLITASTLWQGAGVFLAGLAICIWFGRPILSTVSLLQEISAHRPEALRRAVVVCPIVLSLIIAFLLITPWPFARTAPGFVEYRDLVTLRAKAPGFVRKIHVRDGELVSPGQLLIELQNPELEVERGELEIAIQQSELRQQQFLQSAHLAELQIEQEKKIAFKKRLAEVTRRIEQTNLHAPIAGRVMARDLASRHDTYAQEGAELLIIGQELEKEFRASLSQEDAKLIDSRGSVRIRLHRFGVLEGTARIITPVANRTPPHPSLAVNGGGSLPVRLKSSDHQTANEKELFEFIEPRVTVAFNLADSSLLKSWPTGTMGFVRIESHHYRSLGHGLWQSASKLIRDKIDLAWKAADSKS